MRLAAQPDPGPIEQLLSGLDAKGRAGVKSAVLSEAVRNMEGAPFQESGLLVEMLCPVEAVFDRAGNVVGLRVQAVAYDQYGELLPASDWWHVVINPPVKVPDGTYHQETDPDTGEKVEVPNFREDPAAAFRSWLVGSLKFEARRMGWQG